MKRFLIPILSLLLFSSFASEGVNPFMQFVGKPYGSYHYALRDSMRKRYDGNNYLFVQRTVAQLRALPDKLHDRQWQLEADFLESNYEHDYRNGDNKEFVDKLNKMLEISEKYNKVFKVRILRRLFDLYNGDQQLNDFRYARLLEKSLQGITIEEYPDVIDCIFRLGQLYLEHKDYLRAEKCFKEVVATPVIQQNQRLFIHSRNNLGIIQRDYYHNLDLADRWFRSIFAFRDRYGIIELADQWDAIAKGNLGIDHYLRHNYLKAEPLMKESFNVMYGAKDYTYSYHMACALAECYCGMKQYSKALHYIHMADSCNKQNPLELSRQGYFIAKSKYFSGSNNANLASLYLDSAFYARNEYDLHHNLKPFLKIEQQMAQDELSQKAAESQANYKKFISILLASILIFIALVLYIILYFQKRKAYHALVLKNQQWAEGNNLSAELPSSTVQHQEENELLKTILDYFETSQCFCDNNLTLDLLAKRLGINRTYVSNAINQSNDNFNSLINKYRIRFAIRLLSKNDKRSMEDLALAVGFNNRKSFYNAFHAFAGLSPSQFRDNLKNTKAS
jgi:AraC-like DNA-binding protein